MNSDSDQELLDTVQETLRPVGLTLPYLVGLIPENPGAARPPVGKPGHLRLGPAAGQPGLRRSLSSRDLLFLLTHKGIT